MQHPFKLEFKVRCLIGVQVVPSPFRMLQSQTRSWWGQHRHL